MAIRGVNLGKRIDSAATKVLTPVAARMAKSQNLGRLAMATSNLMDLTTLICGYRSWKGGSALQAAAEKRGFNSYSELVGSNIINVGGNTALSTKLTAAVKTEQVITWWMFGFHLNAVTHMALDKLFPSADSAVSTVAEALSYVGGAWGNAALYGVVMTALLLINHESGHYKAAVDGGNLRSAIMEPILKMQQKPFSQRMIWKLNNWAGRLLIPFGKFEGIVRPNALDYEVDGAAPLNVRAAGPKRDLILGIPILLISLASLTLLTLNVGESSPLIQYLRDAAEWLFPAGVASLYGAFRYDNGALIENYRVNREQRKVIAEGRKGQEKVAFDLTEAKKGIEEADYGD